MILYTHIDVDQGVNIFEIISGNWDNDTLSQKRVKSEIAETPDRRIPVWHSSCYKFWVYGML